MANPAVVAQYRAVCDRMAAIASGCDPDVTVPACPDWTVRDLFAHVASVANSWVHHDLEHYGSQPWAQAGVDRLAGLDIDQLVEAWRADIDRFPELSDEPGMGDPAVWAFGDAAAHEVDLRALLAPGTTLPDEALQLALGGAWGMFRRTLRHAGTPPLIIELDMGDQLSANPADPEGSVPTTRLRIARAELYRMLMARRSAAQIRAYDWDGDPEPYLAAGLAGPNIPAGSTGLDTWPSADLVETPVA